MAEETQIPEAEADKKLTQLLEVERTFNLLRPLKTAAGKEVKEITLRVPCLGDLAQLVSLPYRLIHGVTGTEVVFDGQQLLRYIERLNRNELTHNDVLGLTGNDSRAMYEWLVDRLSLMPNMGLSVGNVRGN